MTGYRENSGYDPYAYQRPGPPVRPFNWVQWAGLGAGAVGTAIFLAYLAGRAGWIPRPLESPMPGVGFLMIGSILINSRRGPSPDGVVRTTSRRTLVAVALGLVAFAIGLAALIYFQGAK